MHALILSHFLTEVVYTPEFCNKNFLKFFTTKLQPQNESKKHTNHIRQLCTGKDRLISVKYRLNFSKVENSLNGY